MKKAIYFSCIGFLLLFISACSGKKEKTPHFNLDESIKSGSLKLSLLADNIRCVALETNGEFIIPDDNTHFWASDKYIITLSNKDIRQFSADGKFIRKLATAGKGPDEYSNIFSYTVDNENDILYYGHQGDWQNIYAINLKDGQPAGKINTKCLPRFMQIVQGNILCIPFDYKNDMGYDAFLINPEGRVLDSITSGSRAPGIVITPKLTLIPSNENEPYISRNDSLFPLNFKQLTPVMAMQYSDKFNPETNLEGLQCSYLFKNKDYVIIKKEEVKMQKSESSIMMTINNGATVIIDIRNSEPMIIDHFYVDPLDTEYNYFPSFNLTGKKLVWNISAFNLKELVQKKREEGKTLSPVLQQLDEQLTEESNPVLIISDLK